jgi:hypothetical protein
MKKLIIIAAALAAVAGTAVVASQASARPPCIYVDCPA